MNLPLIILAGFAVVLGFVGTPAWPWFHAFLEGHRAEVSVAELFSGEFMALAAKSALIVFAGIGLGWGFYGVKSRGAADEADVLEKRWPDVWGLLSRKWFVDEFYQLTFIKWHGWLGRAADAADRWVFGGVVQVIGLLTVGLAWLDRVVDEFLINLGFDAGCESMRRSGGLLSRIQNGQVQTYLRLLGVGVLLLVIVLAWRAA
jgi:NADH-quinone oxidoreductase subunit L